MKKLILILIFSIFNFVASAAEIKDFNSKDILAQRGCCSHHGGVCGCGGYKLQCCDGTLSPSCKCFQDDQESKEDINQFSSSEMACELNTDNQKSL